MKYLSAPRPTSDVIAPVGLVQPSFRNGPEGEYQERGKTPAEQQAQQRVHMNAECGLSKQLADLKRLRRETESYATHCRKHHFTAALFAARAAAAYAN